jgi:hypothetical protein
LPDDLRTHKSEHRCLRPPKQSIVRAIMRQPLVIRRADHAMMLLWTKISDVTCCAGQKMKFAASAGNMDGTHPRPTHSDSGN